MIHSFGKRAARTIGTVWHYVNLFTVTVAYMTQGERKQS